MRGTSELLSDLASFRTFFDLLPVMIARAASSGRCRRSTTAG